MDTSIALYGQVGSQVRSRCAPLVTRLMRARTIAGLAMARVDTGGQPRLRLLGLELARQ